MVELSLGIVVNFIQIPHPEKKHKWTNFLPLAMCTCPSSITLTVRVYIYPPH